MKSDIIYKPVGWLMGGLARLPFGALYAISDLLCFLARDVVRYRRKVVDRNLAESFPDMPEKERRKIARDFYRNFTDYFMETIKLAHVTDREILDRIEFVGLDHIDDYLDRGRSVALYFSHCFNWEWAPAMTRCMRHPIGEKMLFTQVYRHLDNRWFNDYFLKLRSRFDSVSYEKRTVFRDLLRLRRDGVLSVTGFMSDQKPSHNDQIHVVKFLNHPTAIITGTETIIRKLDLVTFYWDMEKTGRGRYRLSARFITDTPDAEKPYYITDTYARMLQQTIERNPSNWLWTHKRWKNKVDYSDDTTRQQ